ncbi:MAG: carbohydrate ABC transporter permease [Actinobacteria bacterium]|nr:carbohydrate ABC transporter permease [Actinomycetota bacterium]MDA2976638.1 carbohydrate ABC transporter permease [Actinomycetota bacterium]MDA2985564.1 carbohydrate ABC transporter permease [Actinomycetota bacterium]
MTSVVGSQDAKRAKKIYSQDIKDRFISLFIGIFAIAWIFPIVWTLWSSFRPYTEIMANGVLSAPQELGLFNYSDAIGRMELPTYFANSALITIPAVFLTLLFGSLIAFVVTRYSFKLNVAMLLLFTAGNMLPPQLVFIPVFKLYLILGDLVGDRRFLYDNHWGVVLIHVAFQMGFATFVLSSYMKTIPKEISESAMVDGASVFTHFFRVMLPLLRPPLASLAVLMTTWIYNDFFWALVLMSTDLKRPITSALGRLQGEFTTDYNLLAAGAMIAAIPTLIVFFVMRKQFVGGLTLGSTKG